MSVGLWHPVRWEHERLHRVLVQRTRTQRAAGRFLVDEHGALAVRAAALAHRGRLSGLVRHRIVALGGSGHPLPSARFSPTLNQGAGNVGPPAVQMLLRSSITPLQYVARGRDPPHRSLDATRPSWAGGPRPCDRYGMEPSAPLRQLGSCSCACLGGRMRARARVANSTATCCSARAWSHSSARRRSCRSCTACSAVGAVARMRPGTSPLPPRSHPFAGPASG
jgi:hypothetical protein